MFRHLTLTVLSLSLLALPASAERLSEDDDRFWLSLGALLADIDTDIEVSVEGGTGTPGNLEERFGLDSDKSEFRLEGQIHLTTRHRLFVSWMSFSRSTTGTLSEEFEYGDVTYSAMSELELDGDIDFLTVGYRWDAVDRDNFELGVSLAPVFLDVDTTLTGSGTVSDGMTTVPFTGSRSAGVDAPVPLLGVHFDWNKDRKYWARTSLQYIAADLGDFDGSMFEGEARFDWFPTDVFGLGLGYSYTKIELDDFKQPNFDGSYDSTYSSLFGYLSFSF